MLGLVQMKFKYVFFSVISLFMTIFVVEASFAIDEDEIKKAYLEAAKKYRGEGEIAPDLLEVNYEPVAENVVEIETSSDSAIDETKNSPLEDEAFVEAKTVQKNEPYNTENLQKSLLDEDVVAKTADEVVIEAESSLHDDNFQSNQKIQEVVESKNLAPVRDGIVRILHSPVISQNSYGTEELSEIVLEIDMENKTIREVMDEIIIASIGNVGAWNIKWRLKKENDYILKEKVNITAETTFKSFVNYLVERIKNMTGVQLFVTVFDSSRIIIISDTYY